MLEQPFLACAVERSHAADVTEEVPLDDEICGGCLVQGGGAAVHHRADGTEGLHQGLRQDHVAQAQRGVKHLAEGADVDDLLPLIHGEQRR
ncbi:hypothetical protein D3C80_1923300 [compost metagenome]